MTRFKLAISAALAIAALGSAGALMAQASGLTRTLVGRADVSVPGREAVIARVEVAPGAKAGRHTHPGDEISYVLEGEATLLIGTAPSLCASCTTPAGITNDSPAFTVRGAWPSINKVASPSST